MNDIIGIKFLLKYGAWLANAIRAKDANEIVHKWSNGDYPVGATIGGYSPLPGEEQNVWTIMASDVVGVHTFRLDQAQQSPPPGQGIQRLPPRGPYGYLSGN